MHHHDGLARSLKATYLFLFPDAQLQKHHCFSKKKKKNLTIINIFYSHQHIMIYLSHCYSILSPVSRYFICKEPQRSILQCRKGYTFQNVIQQKCSPCEGVSHAVNFTVKQRQFYLHSPYLRFSLHTSYSVLSSWSSFERQVENRVKFQSDYI